MLVGGKKRLRDTLAEKMEAAAQVTARAAASVKSALTSRLAATPPFWRHAASALDVTGIDAFLVCLGRSVATALHDTTVSAVAAHTALQSTRAGLHAAIDARFDELAAAIDSLKSGKVAALERELVEIDRVLERWRAESAEACKLIGSLPDSELVTLQRDLSSHIDDMVSQLKALPTVVVEPPFLGFRNLSAPLLTGIADFGRVVAPLAITAADLTLESVPRIVCPGDTLHLRLSLGAQLASESAAELDVSLGMLVGAIRVEATLEGPWVKPQPLQATLAPHVTQRCVYVCIRVPTSFADGTCSLQVTVYVAGQQLAGHPLTRRLCRGVMAPLVLQLSIAGSGATPCVSPEGRVYCPLGVGPEVAVFDADGFPLPGLTVASIGLSTSTRWSAYAHSDSPTLLLADLDGTSSQLVAVDSVTHAVCWTCAVGSVDNCFGLAVLPSLGVVVSNHGRHLLAHRLSDGKCVGGLGVPGLDLFLAADPATGTVYGSRCCDILGCVQVVHEWQCVSDIGGIRITSAGFTIAEKQGVSHPLAVMPAAPGTLISHLVIGSSDTDELIVLSLPGLALVHTHRLEGMQVTGLAADPLGGAVVVCDRVSGATHIIAWPLPDMSPPREQLEIASTSSHDYGDRFGIDSHDYGDRDPRDYGDPFGIDSD